MGNPLQKVIQFFSTSSSSRTISIIVIFIIAAAIPLTVMVSQQQQETRQHAAVTPVAYQFGDSSSIHVGGPNFDATSITGWQHRVSTGSNQVVLINVSIKVNTISTAAQAPKVTSITYGGRSLTRLGGRTSDDHIRTLELWYLKAPPQGLNNFVVNVSRPSEIIAGAMTFSNVDQTTPFGQYLAYTGNGRVPTNLNYNPTTQGLTVGAGDVMVDAITFDRIAPIGSCNQAAGPNQILTWANSNPASSTTGAYNQPGFSNVAAGSYANTPGYTGFMQWTITCNDSTGSNSWLYQVTALRAAGSTPITSTITPPGTTATATPTLPSGGACTVGTVHGRVFVDANENKTYDPTEQGFTSINIPGGTTATSRVLMWVNDPTGLAQNTDLSGGNGLYKFNSLNGSLSYWLRFTAPSGYRITTQPTAPMQTNLPYRRERTANLLFQIDYPNTIKFPPCDQTYDFGITNVPANLKGTVFIDDGRGGGIARNGNKETGEIGYSGATVRIPFGIPGTTVTTNSSGAYLFTNVDTQSSYHTVSLIIPSGYELTTPQGVNAFPSSIDSLANGVTGNTVNFGIAPIPTPNCTSGQTCTPCAPNTNSCNGSGTRSCTLTTTSTGSTNCNQVTTFNLICSGAPANCASPNVCNSSNQCVAPTGVPTGVPTDIPTVTSPPGVTITQTPTGIPTAVPTIPAGNTVFALNIGLDGIGTTGDNASPQNSSGSNKNPLHPSRNVTIEVFDDNGASVANKSGTLAYQTGSGKFTGTVDMGSLASANYNAKIKSPGYLRRLIPGIQNVTSGQTHNLPAANLVTGDINGDNAINILDYNILISCSIFSKDNHAACSASTQNAVLSDLDDNGLIDQFDYNLFVRELSVQNGD